MKKIFIFAVLSVLTFTSCKKEIKSPDNNPLQPVQKEANGTAGLKAKTINYRASSEKGHQLLLNNQETVKQKIKKLTLERSQYLNKPGVLSAMNAGRKSVIHVPEDYPSLQAAIDNSGDGGKIIVQGTILQSGDVMVDIPNLTIQGGGEGDDESATINDNSSIRDNLVVTAPGVTVKISN